MRRVRRRLVPIGMLACGAVLLGACGFGTAGDAARVTDIGARLSGSVRNTNVEPTDYWFEYGTSSDYGSSTRGQP